MYAAAIEFLESKGYHQYEISNFSKDGLECRHNKIYWNLENYIGCGSSSHSYVDGIRYRNQGNIEKYIEMMNSVNSGVVEEIKNTQKDDMEEFMFLGLRLIEGVSIEKFYQRFKISIFEKYEDIINKYVKMGLLNLEDQRLFLTSRGIELSNQVMSEFIL